LSAAGFTNDIFWEPDGFTPGDPKFGQYGFAGVTILPTSPCVDTGIKMNAKDTIVQHLLTTGDVAWTRANGLDTLAWYGRAPDIGAYETNAGQPVSSVPVDLHRLEPPRR
jgi:hypothetical protein